MHMNAYKYLPVIFGKKNWWLAAAPERSPSSSVRPCTKLTRFDERFDAPEIFVEWTSSNGDRDRLFDPSSRSLTITFRNGQRDIFIRYFLAGGSARLYRMPQSELTVRKLFSRNTERTAMKNFASLEAARAKRHAVRRISPVGKINR